jgi:hypothetical protein
VCNYDPAPPTFNFEHVTIVVGRNEDGELMVASHGGDSGPLVTTHDYRPVAIFAATSESFALGAWSPLRSWVP